MFALSDDDFRSLNYKPSKDDEEEPVSVLNPCCPMPQSEMNRLIIPCKLLSDKSGCWSECNESQLRPLSRRLALPVWMSSYCDGPRH